MTHRSAVRHNADGECVSTAVLRRDFARVTKRAIRALFIDAHSRNPSASQLVSTTGWPVIKFDDNVFGSEGSKNHIGANANGISDRDLFGRILRHVVDTHSGPRRPNAFFPTGEFAGTAEIR